MSSPLSLRKGVSQQTDARAAAHELFAALDQPDIKLAIFYCSPDYDLPALASALHELFGTVQLIGCTTAGEITPQGYLAGSLTGFSLAAEDLDAVVEVIKLDPLDSAATGVAVTSLLKQLGDRDGLPASATDTFAFLLLDGLAMQEEILVSVIHTHLHGIELIGGSAADQTNFKATHVYHNGKFQQNLAVLSLVRTNLPFMVFRTQHFVNSDQRMVVTKADAARRRVYEINGLPAAREYARLIGMEISALSPLIFATHPVVVRVGGQYFVRSVGFVQADESLQFFCAIDEGVVLTIAKSVDMVENLNQAFAEVRASIGAPQLVLGCDCILRRLEIEREGLTDKIGQIFMDNNVIGFATYGEQYNAMHVNQTFTGIAIGSR
ncbi:MAG: nitric oxide-sensing protein NosP [Steroidobacteraceae bacterium]